MWLALGLALVGLAMVAQVFGGGAGLYPLGVAAGLAAAVCLAAFYLLSKRALERHHPLTLTFWMFALAALFWAVVQPWWTFDASILTEHAVDAGRARPAHGAGLGSPSCGSSSWAP